MQITSTHVDIHRAKFLCSREKFADLLFTYNTLVGMLIRNFLEIITSWNTTYYTIVDYQIPITYVGTYYREEVGPSLQDSFWVAILQDFMIDIKK